MINKLQEWRLGFDLEAVTRLWHDCQARSPSVTAQRVLAICDEKFHQKYDPSTGRTKVQNVIGYLLVSVPKAFEKPRVKGS